MFLRLPLFVFYLLVSCTHEQWLPLPQVQQRILNSEDQINKIKSDKFGFVNEMRSYDSGPFNPSDQSLMDPLKSDEPDAFNLLNPTRPVTFQQKLIQIRQRIERPSQPLFSRLTKEDDDDVDEEQEMGDENREIFEPLIPQHRIIRVSGLKPHHTIPALIGMIPTPCGRKMYYPMKHFCYHNRPYSREKFSLCGFRIYKKENSFCFNGQTYSKLRKGLCGNGIYDKLTQMCINHRVRNICAGEIFDPRTHFCYERIYNRGLYSMCGKRVYKKSSHYCLDGRVYQKQYNVMSTSIGTAYIPHELGLWGRSIRKQYQQNRKHYHEPKPVDVRGNRKDLVPPAQPPPYYNQAAISWDTQAEQVGQMLRKAPSLRQQLQRPQIQKGISQVHQQMRPYVKQAPQQPIVRQLPYIQPNVNTQSRQMMQYSWPPALRNTVASNIKPNMQKEHNSDLCGLELLQLKTHFCFEGKVHKRCGMMAYNPRSLLCYRDFLYTKELYNLCGNDMFNKYTQICLNGHVLQRDKNPGIQNVVIDNYGQMSERDRKDQEDIFNLSRQLSAKRKEFQERQEREYSLCAGNRFNKRSQFCYKGKLYSRSMNILCGGFLYNKNSQRCLGGQLFPKLDLNKPNFYVGPGLGVQGVTSYYQG